MASGTPYAHAVRKLILDQSKRAHVGHVGSSMAIADIVTLLFLLALLVVGGAVARRSIGRPRPETQDGLSGHAEAPNRE